MTNDVSIDEFNQGWDFFARKIKNGHQGLVAFGKFPCADFLCSGCDDWLDADNQNRNIDKLQSTLKHG